MVINLEFKFKVNTNPPFLLSPMAGRAVIRDLEAWEGSCSASMRSSVHGLLTRARALVDADEVQQITSRALVNRHRATRTAWTDAACGERFCAAPSAIGKYSCDTRLLSTPSGWFLENEPTMDSLKVSSQVPLSMVDLYDGMTAEDWLVDVHGVAAIPRMCTVKVKSLLVPASTADVMLETRAYRGVRTTTFAMHATGSFKTMGARSGNGLLGFGSDDGQMKAFKLCAPREGGDTGSHHIPAAWGPAASGITTCSSEIIMTVTLYRSSCEGEFAACSAVDIGMPVYRGLCHAAVTVSATDIGADLETPDLKGEVVDAVCIEIFRCFALDDSDISNSQTDDMCLGNLRMQANIGGNSMGSSAKAGTASVLVRLEGNAFCSAGHGPFAFNSMCTTCGARCVCA